MEDVNRIKHLLTCHPEITAMICVSHAITDLVAQVALELGKKIPEDFSVISFDAPRGGFFTSIIQNEREIGLASVKALCNCFVKESESVFETIDTELYIGQSTAKAASIL